MIDRTVTTQIDPELCVGCGECMRVCPNDTIELIEGKATVTGDRSLGCGHCAAVCPCGAIRVLALENDSLEFKTFKTGQDWMSPGQADPGELVRLMRSRRSCRNYREKAVSRETLEDLVKIGITAPSGTNSQLWSFTVLDNRPAVENLAQAIGDFFRKLNQMSEKVWLRKGLRLIGKPELDNYYRDYHETVTKAMEEFDETGRDRLFHGAPAVIMVGSQPGASCPSEDALLATGNILLAAHAMGLGTCLIGFAVEAFKNAPQIKDTVNIPRDERIYAVIALGYPEEQYMRLTGRKKFLLRHAG